MFGNEEEASSDVRMSSFSNASSRVRNGEGSLNQHMKLGEWIVNKFGGTSVESPEAIRNVCDIIINGLEDSTSRSAVVVSAIGGKPKVTDLMLHALDLAATANFESASDVVDGICKKHIEYMNELCIPWNEAQTIIKNLNSDIEDIQHILKVVSLFRYQTQVMKDLVSGYGEVWSAQVLCAALNARGVPFSFVNARNNILIVDNTLDTGVEVEWEASYDRLRDILSNLGKNAQNIVITGYVACTKEGIATTLRRDGSDYSASIFGKLLNAKVINIWTDVDGIMSADPRLVQEARVLKYVSYNEVLELSYFGAKVIHQKAISPASLAGIPIYVKNTFNPLGEGTCISYSQNTTEGRPGCVSGISILRDVVLLNVEGTGMIGVPGIAKRMFRSLYAKSISVIFVSQASSELSITIAVNSALADTAQACILDAFAKELSVGSISKVAVIPSCSIVTIVSDSMMHQRNVSGRFFSALGRASISVKAIAQGSNERNVSCVVNTRDSAMAVRVVHDALIAPANSFDIGVYGADSPVGDALIKIACDSCSTLNQRYNSNLRVYCIMDDGQFIAGGDHGEQPPQKSRMKADKKNWENNAIESKKWDCYCQAIGGVGESKLGLKGQQPTVDMNRSLPHALHSVFIDCSSGEDVPGKATERHNKWLNSKVNVISNNPSAIYGMLHRYNSSLSNHSKIGGDGVQYIYENALLPINIPIFSTLQNLEATGDRIERIEFSISSLLNHVVSLVNPSRGKSNDLLSGQMTLTEAIRFVAHDERWKDITNLPGDEIRMWLLILGLRLGLELENDMVKVETPIPSCVYERVRQTYFESSSFQSSAVQDGSKSVVNSRENNPPNIDGIILGDDAILAANAAMSDRVEAAKAKAKVLRYVATIDVLSRSARANLCEVDLCDDFASVDGATCCVRIEILGKETPVVLKGPAMMPKDTANIIFSEIAHLAQELRVFQSTNDIDPLNSSTSGNVASGGMTPATSSSSDITELY